MFFVLCLTLYKRPVDGIAVPPVDNVSLLILADDSAWHSSAQCGTMCLASFMFIRAFGGMFAVFEAFCYGILLAGRLGGVGKRADKTQHPLKCTPMHQWAEEHFTLPESFCSLEWHVFGVWVLPYLWRMSLRTKMYSLYKDTGISWHITYANKLCCGLTDQGHGQMSQI